MNRRTLVTVAVAAPAVGLLGLLAWALAQSGGSPGGLGINNVFGEVTFQEGPAPSLSLPLLTGETLDLADIRGKVVMVDFWSSWCPPCIEEAPVLAATYPQYADRGVEFVGVAMGTTRVRSTGTWRDSASPTLTASMPSERWP